MTEDLATLIATARERQGLSRRELARRAGVCPAFVNYLEAGERLPTPEHPRRSLAVAVIERWHAERVRLGLVRPGPAPGPTAERIAKINARGMDLERWSLVVRRAARDLEMQAERGRCSVRATSGASFFTIETLARQRQRYLEAEHLDDRPAPDMGVDVAGILRGMT